MMSQIYNTFRPTGFGRVSVYLFREDPKALIDFLQKAFYAEEIDWTVDEESGVIRNCIMKIGDSCFILSLAAGNFGGMPTAFYL